MKPRVLRPRNPGRLAFLGICDPHLTGQSPPAYKVNYQELLWDVFRQLWKFSKEKEIDAVLIAGDLFHRKAASQNPLSFVTDTIRLLKEPRVPILGVAGNHDVKYGSWTRGLKGQPLDNLIAHGAYHLLDEEAVVFDDPKQSRKVAIRGESYHHARIDAASQMEQLPEDHLAITLLHIWLTTGASGELYGEPTYGPDKLTKLNSDVLLIGHHHADQGILKVGSKQIVGTGSLTRTGAHEHDLVRRPAASYIEIEDGQVRITTIRPKFPSAADSLDLEKHEQMKREKEDLELFTQALAEEQTTAKDPLEILAELAPPTEVKKVAQEYLQKAEERAA